MKTTMFLGLTVLALSACGSDPLQYDVTAGDVAAEVSRETPDAPQAAPEATPDTPPAPPAPVACDLRGLNFFEYACPGHPLCVRCRDEEPSGTGYLPLGCIAPSGGACVDFCEFCN